MAVDATDRRWMRATLRLARRHEGLTADNPSVGTLVVRDGRVVGRGVTAPGGRPHAEPIALREAGELAEGATAYVTLEPCAHSARTPPCAQTLIDARVARVVTAYRDPDARVDGKGHAMLRAAGIAVDVGCESERAARDLGGYLMRKTAARPLVTLKLALTRDGFIGREGEEVAITGHAARAQVHALRAKSDAILVGRGTVLADDPVLDVRLRGLEGRSPRRYAFARAGEVREGATRLESGTDLAVLLAGMAAGATPVSTLLVEGGAKLARSFLRAGLVDRIVRFTAPHDLRSGIASPIPAEGAIEGFRETDRRRYGADECTTFERI